MNIWFAISRRGATCLGSEQDIKGFPLEITVTAWENVSIFRCSFWVSPSFWLLGTKYHLRKLQLNYMSWFLFAGLQVTLICKCWCLNINTEKDIGVAGLVVETSLNARMQKPGLQANALRRRKNNKGLLLLQKVSFGDRWQLHHLTLVFPAFLAFTPWVIILLSSAFVELHPVHLCRTALQHIQESSQKYTPRGGYPTRSYEGNECSSAGDSRDAYFLST